MRKRLAYSLSPAKRNFSRVALISLFQTENSMLCHTRLSFVVLRHNPLLLTSLKPKFLSRILDRAHCFDFTLSRSKLFC